MVEADVALHFAFQPERFGWNSSNNWLGLHGQLGQLGQHGQQHVDFAETDAGADAEILTDAETQLKIV